MSPSTPPKFDQVLNYQHIVEHCKQIAEEFKITDFFQERYSGDEDKEFRGFRQEREAIQNALELALRASALTQDVVFTFPPSILTSLEENILVLKSTLSSMRDFYQQIKPRKKASPFDDFEKGNNEVEIALRKQKQREKKKLLIESFFSCYEPFSNQLNDIVIYDDRKKNAAQSIRLQQQIDELRIQDAVSPHANLFEEQADNHACSSKLWLLIGVLGLFFTVLYSHNEVYIEVKSLIKESMPWGNILCLTLLNLFALGLMSSFVFWAFKNYNLNKHNELLNRTKATALKTFHNFSTATKPDPEAHRIVLHKMTDTIFNLNDFGYLITDKAAQNTLPSEVLETLIKISNRS